MVVKTRSLVNFLLLSMCFCNVSMIWSLFGPSKAFPQDGMSPPLFENGLFSPNFKKNAGENHFLFLRYSSIK